ncbi:cysteine-tryptophan domain-containing zinc finger protein 7-like [Aristolochia californica]|uniref:cysteine-tryptophan domain-containing zinc finger protein 7-like n=1 Tax=Aristolochia californica TaxID=171875 RepID=UPI0035DC35B4
MLSLGSRDARKGLGLGFSVGTDMEENELEEGEASYYHDDDAGVDPDKDFSYLDQKIHQVLGHFQKDFEGGVSAENLGAKFGGYGSFLPSYQRFPSIWAHPKSPQKQTTAAPKSPINLPPENACQNLTISGCESQFLRSCPGNVQSASALSYTENSAKRDGCFISNIAVSSQHSPKHHEAVNKPAHANDQKTLKVRIKVGNDNSLARKNAAIYSGLGLDISPSSSLEDSPDASGELSPEVRVEPDESPRTIIQIMTSPVLGGYFLSPLPESLLHLPEKEKLFSKDSKPGKVRKVGQEMSSVPSAETKGSTERKTKSTDKIDANSFLEFDIDIETPAGREMVSNALKIPILFGSKAVCKRSERLVNGDLAKLISKESNRSVTKERSSVLDLLKEESLESVAAQVNTRNDEPLSIRGKLGSKMSSDEKALEEKKANSLCDVSFDHRKDEKFFDAIRTDPDGFRGRIEQPNESMEPARLKSIKKASSVEQDAVKVHQGKEQLSGGKKKVKGSKSNINLPAVEIPKEGLKLISSVQIKEKKSAQTREIFSENKNDSSGYRKDSSKTICKDSHRDSSGDLKYEQAESDRDPIDANKGRSKDLRLDADKDSQTVIEKSKERSGGRKVENMSTTSDLYAKGPAVTALMNGPSNEAGLATVVAPVLVQETWVCCDRCETWRLLPYHVNPLSLPKKWLCNLMDWLPGMNKCSFSEEETTRALHASYQNPVMQAGPSSGVPPTVLPSNDQTHQLSAQALLVGGKKKHGGSKDTPNPANSTSLTLVSYSTKKSHQVSVKSRSINDVNQSSLDSNPANKSSFTLTTKTNDLTVEKPGHKQKEKHRQLERYSDGGDYVEQSGKSVKTKSNKEAERDLDQDAFRNSKKIKREDSQYSVDDGHSDHEPTGRAASNFSNCLPIKLSGKNSQKQQSYSSSKDSKGDVKEYVHSSIKKPKSQVESSLPGKYDAQLGALYMSNPGKSDMATKKRKVKEWQESQMAHPVSGDDNLNDGVSLKEEMSESENRKEKKLKLSKSNLKECSNINVDGRTDKKGRITKILLCGNRDPVADNMDVEKRSLDGTDSLKKDLGYKTESSVAATSSSSKISGSRKSKTNCQEVKGSPVESVSSSPMRVSNSDRFIANMRTLQGKDEATNLGLSDGEDGGLGRHGKIRKGKAFSIVQNNSSLESNRIAESLILDPLRGVHDDYQDERDADRISGGKSKDKKLPKTFGGSHYKTFPPQIENINMVNEGSSFDTLDLHNSFLSQPIGKDPEHNQDKQNNHYRANGSSQRKSTKSSSKFKEKPRSDRDKKLSNFPSEQGEPGKGGGTYRYEADTESHGQPFHERDRDGKFNKKSGKEDDNYMGRKDTAAKWSCDSRRETILSKFGIPEFSDLHSPMLIKHQTDPISKSGKANPQINLPQISSHEEERSVSRVLSERADQAETGTGRGKSLPPADKHEMQGRSLRAVPAPHKGSRSDVLLGDAAGTDALKLPRQPRKSDNPNGVHKSGLRHLTPNGTATREPDAPSPVLKDSCQIASSAVKDVKDLRHTAESAMREAKDLKHTADRVKNGGGQESTGLYFEAALKFLHGASLLEPVCSEGAKHGETTQSMQVYTDTAKLCEFCAHEYEKHKDMAAACLAYKCMEVAYMRVIYSKNSSANKDRHELQSALQMVLPGESPSSSASDVDNLNNQATVDKTALAKSVNSPQIAGNHVIVARNRPNFVRLLNFAQDMNSAMEALRKSQNAFAVANANEDPQYRPEGISYVKRVLEFNIHDVEGILRLVRVAMESIGH